MPCSRGQRACHIAWPHHVFSISTRLLVGKVTCTLCICACRMVRARAMWRTRPIDRVGRARIGRGHDSLLFSRALHDNATCSGAIILVAGVSLQCLLRKGVQLTHAAVRTFVGVKIGSRVSRAMASRTEAFSATWPRRGLGHQMAPSSAPYDTERHMASNAIWSRAQYNPEHHITLTRMDCEG